MHKTLTKRIIFTIDDVKEILRDHQGVPADCEINFHLSDISTDIEKFPRYEVHQVVLSYEVKK